MSEAGSGIEGFRHASPFAEYIAGRLTTETFKLVDVGCAGGLARGWRAFGDKLQAVGFDTNAEEVARLNAAEANPGVRYVAGWVGMPDDHPLKQRIGSKAYWHHWPSGRLAYERTYDLRNTRQAQTAPLTVDGYFQDKVLKQDWLTTPVGGFDLDFQRTFEVFPPSDAWPAETLQAGPNSVIHLPAYLKAAAFYDADFLKLDIDGPDYEVLRSISDLLTQPSLIGLSLEVCFYGSHDANDNSFHNMDRLMRQKGFDLMGLSVRTYASAALPSPYLDAHPSMNAAGRPIQGDALYVRDLGSRVWAQMAADLSDEKLAKTAALLALFNLPDSAAEILIVHRDRLSRILDVDHGLDLLATQIQEDDTIAPTYRDYIAAFEAEDGRFFDRYSARNTWWDQTLRAAAAAPEVQARLDKAEQALLKAEAGLAVERDRALALEAEQARLAALQAENERLRHSAERADQDRRRLAAIEASSSWRLTAPLRRILSAFKSRG